MLVPVIPSPTRMPDVLVMPVTMFDPLVSVPVNVIAVDDHASAMW